MNVKYPQMKVRLVREDGNAFSIIGRVRRATRQAGLPSEICDEFSKEAMSGDYDHVLQTAMKYVEVL